MSRTNKKRKIRSSASVDEAEEEKESRQRQQAQAYSVAKICSESSVYSDGKVLTINTLREMAYHLGLIDSISSNRWTKKKLCDELSTKLEFTIQNYVKPNLQDYYEQYPWFFDINYEPLIQPCVVLSSNVTQDPFGRIYNYGFIIDYLKLGSPIDPYSRTPWAKPIRIIQLPTLRDAVLNWLREVGEDDIEEYQNQNAITSNNPRPVVNVSPVINVDSSIDENVGSDALHALVEYDLQRYDRHTIPLNIAEAIYPYFVIEHTRRLPAPIQRSLGSRSYLVRGGQTIPLTIYNSNQLSWKLTQESNRRWKATYERSEQIRYGATLAELIASFQDQLNLIRRSEIYPLSYWNLSLQQRREGWERTNALTRTQKIEMNTHFVTLNDNVSMVQEYMNHAFIVFEPDSPTVYNMFYVQASDRIIYLIPKQSGEWQFQRQENEASPEYASLEEMLNALNVAVLPINS